MKDTYWSVIINHQVYQNRKIYIFRIINNYTMAVCAKARIREWGNSFGIVIPRELVLKGGFKVNDRVDICIERKQNLKEFFGRGKGKVKNIQEAKNEVRKSWKMD